MRFVLTINGTIDRLGDGRSAVVIETVAGPDDLSDAERACVLAIATRGICTKIGKSSADLPIAYYDAPPSTRH